jgi:hypothetical protein
MRISTRHRIFWTSAIVFAFLGMAYLIIPPMLNLNYLRTSFSKVLTNATGEPVQVYGDVRLSLLGHPMLALEKVKIGDISVESARFRIPWTNVFDLSNANITGGIKISGANIEISSLSIPNFGRKVMISNSYVKYNEKLYEITNGVFDAGKISARIRVGDHKYNLDVINGTFTITNPNEKLVITGKLIADQDGVISVSGKLSVDTENTNQLFDFDYPKISGQTKFNMDFIWDGKGFFDFSNIDGMSEDRKFNGEVKLWYEKGELIHRSVTMSAAGGSFDLSFLNNQKNFLYMSDFNIKLAGKISTGIDRIKKLNKLVFKSFSGDYKNIDLQLFQADDGKMQITATGKLYDNTANNLDVGFYKKNPEQSVHCMLSGTNNNWSCSQWSFVSSEMSAKGSINVSPDNFSMTFNSENAEMKLDSVDKVKSFVGNKDGNIKFVIGDASGDVYIKDGKKHIEYVQKNVALNSLPVEGLPLPELMLKENGNIAAMIDDNNMSFVFQTSDWSFGNSDDDGFTINHKNARRLLSMFSGKSELPFLKKNLPIIITGKYNKNMVSNLRMQIGDTIFSGMLNDKTLSIKTAFFDFDEILDQEWFNNFVDNQYLSGDPMLAPFDFGINVAVAADQIKLGGTKYDGFVYSLAGNTQKMSISDSENGDMLLSVSKNKSEYKYLVQLNKFFVPGNLFSEKSPVNINGTTVTAQAEISSFGMTAYDIRRNQNGIVDISLDGGVFVGLGTDGFYANVNNYGRMDTENALNMALGKNGQTAIKEMQITGEYNGGDFTTTKPFFLTAKYTDITGNFDIKNDAISIRANITLRGTSPVPKPIKIAIDGRGRDYSLSDILPNIDLDYLREFVATHKKF